MATKFWAGSQAADLGQLTAFFLNEKCYTVVLSEVILMRTQDTFMLKKIKKIPVLFLLTCQTLLLILISSNSTVSNIFSWFQRCLSP